MDNAFDMGESAYSVKPTIGKQSYHFCCIDDRHCHLVLYPCDQPAELLMHEISKLEQVFDDGSQRYI